MRIVVSWLREFCPTELEVDELAEVINRQGVKVEEILRPWDGIEGVVVARVIDVSDHPDSDKLCVATVDDGTGHHVVCAGVRNFAPGDLVPWAKPGARVPALAEPLAPRTLRGVVSNGMLCSPQELNIADVHTGILVLDPGSLALGDDVKTALGLDDSVIDIEVEPNRPDFLSVLGVAREVSAATGVPLVAPEVLENADGPDAATLASVEIEASDGCPQYLAKVISGVDVSRPSPLIVQARLTAAGMRPVSGVVDATNYVMIELGQPLHAFDMDRLAGPGIVVRRAEPGERLTTLDDVDRQMEPDDLLICDLDGPVAIAGVMGGASTEVSDATDRVLLESAYFTRTGVLRTARRLELYSEASHRFERGTDPERLGSTATRCARLIATWCGGEVAPGAAAAGAEPSRHWVGMRPSRASTLLDYEVTRSDAEAVFDRLGLAHRSAADDLIEVEAPGYRHDLELEVDLIEEVARIQGYDKIGSTVPSAGRAGGVPPRVAFRERVRDVLVRAGLREVRLLSFASQADVALTGDPDAVPIANPLQADEGLLRTRLTPGLLHAVARNQARGSETVAVFETGTVFRLGSPVEERPKVALALAGPVGRHWASHERELDVLDAKGAVADLMDSLGIVEWTLDGTPGGPFHPGRSAFVRVGSQRAGVVGEIHPRIAAALEIEGRCAIAELELDALFEAAPGSLTVVDVPRFPPVRRDLAFVVGEQIEAGQVAAEIASSAGELLGSCTLFDVFRGGSIPAGSKSLAFAVDLRAPDRTLTREETDPVVAGIQERLLDRFGAQLRQG